MRTLHGIAMGLFMLCCPGLAHAQRVAPADFVIVKEAIVAHDPAQDLASLGTRIDRRSNLRIVFDQQKAIEAFKRDTQRQKLMMTIRVRAQLQRADGQPQAIPVDNYSIVEQTRVNNKDAVAIVYSDEIAELSKSAQGVTVDQWIPNSFVNLTEQGLQVGDRLFLKITDIETQLDVDYVVEATEFGLNQRLLDTFLLLRRVGVTAAEEVEGVRDINFRPAPGVLFSWVYLARGNAFTRALAPGFGYVVSFTDWNDPAFDPAAGKFAKGTDSNKIEIATGPALTLFDNTLQFSYGWNLNARQDRRYFAVGFSFFKLSNKLAELITQ